MARVNETDGGWEPPRGVVFFVSSTFRDMQRERDALRDVVVPRLRAFAARYGTTVDMLDLRWGVDTSAVDERDHNRVVLRYCRQAIRECEPFFLSLLGDRYGAPMEDASGDGGGDGAGAGDGLAAVCSATEWEIREGLLDDDARDDGAQTSGQDGTAQAGTALCLIRHIDNKERLVGELRDVFVSTGADVMRLNRLKRRIVRRDPDMVERYAVTVHADGSYDLDGFCDAVTRRVEAMLRVKWGVPPRDGVGDAEDAELATHRRMVEARARAFTAREREISEVLAFCGGDAAGAEAGAAPAAPMPASSAPTPPSFMREDASGTVPKEGRFLLVEGPSGSGKTTLMCASARRAAAGVDGEDVGDDAPAVACVLCGSSPMSSSVEGVLRMLVRWLGGAAGAVPADAGVTQLRERFAELLAARCARGPVLLVLDALDRLVDAQGTLAWLVGEIPEGCRIVASAVPGLFDAEAARRSGVVVALPPLGDAETEAIAASLAVRRGRTLPGRVRAALRDRARAAGAGATPLLVSLMVEYLLMIDEPQFRAADRRASHGERDAYVRLLLERLDALAAFGGAAGGVDEAGVDGPADAADADAADAEVAGDGSPVDDAMRIAADAPANHGAGDDAAADGVSVGKTDEHDETDEGERSHAVCPAVPSVAPDAATAVFEAIVADAERIVGPCVRPVCALIAASRFGLRVDDVKIACDWCDYHRSMVPASAAPGAAGGPGEEAGAARIAADAAHILWLVHLVPDLFVRNDQGAWDFAHQFLRTATRTRHSGEVAFYNLHGLVPYLKGKARRDPDLFVCREIMHHLRLAGDAADAMDLLVRPPTDAMALFLDSAPTGMDMSAGTRASAEMGKPAVDGEAAMDAPAAVDVSAKDGVSAKNGTVEDNMSGGDDETAVALSAVMRASAPMDAPTGAGASMMTETPAPRAEASAGEGAPQADAAPVDGGGAWHPYDSLGGVRERLIHDGFGAILRESMIGDDPELSFAAAIIREGTRLRPAERFRMMIACLDPSALAGMGINANLFEQSRLGRYVYRTLIDQFAADAAPAPADGGHRTGNAAYDDAVRAGVARAGATHDGTTHDDATHDGAIRGDVAAGGSTHDDAAHEGMLRADAAIEGAAHDRATRDDAVGERAAGAEPESIDDTAQGNGNAADGAVAAPRRNASARETASDEAVDGTAVDAAAAHALAEEASAIRPFAMMQLYVELVRAYPGVGDGDIEGRRARRVRYMRQALHWYERADMAAFDRWIDIPDAAPWRGRVTAESFVGPLLQTQIDVCDEDLRDASAALGAARAFLANRERLHEAHPTPGSLADLGVAFGRLVPLLDRIGDPGESAEALAQWETYTRQATSWKQGRQDAAFRMQYRFAALQSAQRRGDADGICTHGAALLDLVLDHYRDADAIELASIPQWLVYVMHACDALAMRDRGVRIVIGRLPRLDAFNRQITAVAFPGMPRLDQRYWKDWETYRVRLLAKAHTGAATPNAAGADGVAAPGAPTDGGHDDTPADTNADAIAKVAALLDTAADILEVNRYDEAEDALLQAAKVVNGMDASTDADRADQLFQRIQVRRHLVALYRAMEDAAAARDTNAAATGDASSTHTGDASPAADDIDVTAGTVEDAAADGSVPGIGDPADHAEDAYYATGNLIEAWDEFDAFLGELAQDGAHRAAAATGMRIMGVRHCADLADAGRYAIDHAAMLAPRLGRDADAVRAEGRAWLEQAGRIATAVGVDHDSDERMLAMASALNRLGQAYDALDDTATADRWYGRARDVLDSPLAIEAPQALRGKADMLWHMARRIIDHGRRNDGLIADLALAADALAASLEDAPDGTARDTDAIQLATRCYFAAGQYLLDTQRWRRAITVYAKARRSLKRWRPIPERDQNMVTCLERIIMADNELGRFAHARETQLGIDEIAAARGRTDSR